VIALFKAVNASKFFGTTIALDNISLEFSRGLNILLGPNGSGKSTLLKLWSGLLRPSKGKVFVYDLDPWRYRKHIMEKTSVFFEDLPAPWWMSGEEFLRYVSEKRSLPWGEVKEYAERLGVITYWSRLIRGYSSGMKKKLMLLTALSPDVEGYVLDEPYTLLDKEAVRIIDEIIYEKVKEGRIVLLATHILTGIEKYVEGFAILYSGRVIAKYPGGLAEVPIIIECRGKNPIEIEVEALKLNPSKIEIMENNIRIYGQKTHLLEELIRKYSCVESVDLVSIYRELVKA